MSAEPQRIEQQTPEWYEERKKGLGASDAPAALGFSKWKTPQEVCLDKWGEVEQSETSEVQHRGQVLEPILLKLYERTHGRKGQLNPGCLCRHETIGFMMATPDGFIDCEPVPGLVQIKTSLDWLANEWGDEGTDDIPQHYRIQVAHEMAVTGRNWVDVAVLFASEQVFRMLVDMVESETIDDESLMAMIEGNLDWRVYTVERDEDLEEKLIKAETDFWENYVLKHVLPPDISLCTPSDKECRAATEEEQKQMDIARKHWLSMKKAEARLQAKRKFFEVAIGTGYGIYNPVDKEKITWGKNKDSIKEVTDWEAVIQDLKTQAPELSDKITTAIEANTQTVVSPGSRTFRWPTKKWGAEL